MTPTNDQITEEAWARYNKQKADQIIGQCKPVEHFIIEVVREGWTPPPPVDPDLLAVRGVLALMCNLQSDHDNYCNGRYDKLRTFQMALAAYKAGKEAAQ